CVSFVWVFGVAYVEEHPFCSSCVAQLIPQKRFVYGIFVVCFSVMPVLSSLLLSLFLVRLTRRRRQQAEPGRNSQKLREKIINPLITLSVHAPYRRLISQKVSLVRKRFRQMA
ncbi:hypothetical protein AAVH_24763, partial [Aphelenchoides avenae]